MAAPAPVVAREESVPEFTLRAATAGLAVPALLCVLLYRAGRGAAA